ncbi:YdeI/OmpD-associated family protein [Enterovirga rhinocerotis]|uniref:Uncharacterized protein n=1 Tax=Enterovirga rhinocerotis TaxID=1339210 RepID=A0A4V3DXC6_9HYPH|nr:hypothetical protein [Enterovirga rhinocerotis]TDR88209.1 hypothetical protein EV668_4081 [Enterovirga rhinocerotis]
MIQPIAFRDILDLERWLEAHHSGAAELWLRIFRKASGVPSIDWNDCVLACLAWGWIDSHKRAWDDQSYVQRITPRRPNSNWSQRNIRLAEELIASGRMHPPGLARIEHARSTGRWRS